MAVSFCKWVCAVSCNEVRKLAPLFFPQQITWIFSVYLFLCLDVRSRQRKVLKILIKFLKKKKVFQKQRATCRMPIGLTPWKLKFQFNSGIVSGGIQTYTCIGTSAV